MAANNFLIVGGESDSVTLTIEDVGKLTIWESYEVKISVMTQPAAFNLRLGWGDVAWKLLEMARPGRRFQLRIGEVLVQSGIIEKRGVPKGNSTVVEVSGRDYMRKVMNFHVEEDMTFKEKTYFEITRHVLDLCGVDKHELVAGNGANRVAVTKAVVVAVPAENQVRVIETNLPSPGGSRVEFKWLQAKVGERWYDWLQQQYRLAGLFLWCAGDGKFVLSTPGFQSEAVFEFKRQRGLPVNDVNILDHSFRDDVTNRHAHYIVYGRFGRGKGGRNRIKGEYVDTEMVGYGFTDVITYHEDKISTTEQAEYLARRYASEARRAGWDLTYVLAGHRIPTLDGKIGVLAPDLVSSVADDELNIHGNHYLESVTYSQNPHATTSVSLIRPSDLLYIAEKDQSAQRKAKDQLKSMETKGPY